MTTYHILNGDCLAEQLRQTEINRNFIICRECLIDGDVNAENISDFWEIRANFIKDSYQISTNEYYYKTVAEFEKLDQITDNDEICLWFENDLFCQVNMWFVISLLSDAHKIFRVFPLVSNKENIWKGFEIADPETLRRAYQSKIQLSQNDIELGKNLWKAYQKSDFIGLKKLAKRPSDCYEYLEEVCQAHLDRFPQDKSLGRPDKVVNEIIKAKSPDFQTVFSTFSAREGIYGFGDLQVKKIYDRQRNSLM